MYSDPLRDPRYEPLRPTPDEVEAWAGRERKRREAWLAGPTEDEREEWVRSYRRRAALGLAESRLGPSPPEVDEWADREHKRRHAWLAGPTDDEKRVWAHRATRRAAIGLEESGLEPTTEEIDEWAARETRRRQEWLAGPTEDEKRRWARRETGGLWDLPDSESVESALVDSVQRLVREADLATKGSLSAAMRAPLAIWSHLVRAGERFEDDFYQPPPRRRVRF